MKSPCMWVQVHFNPLKPEWIADHEMHAEYFEVDQGACSINGLHCSEKVTSVGTTTVRTLESLYWLGVKLIELVRTHPD